MKWARVRRPILVGEWTLMGHALPIEYSQSVEFTQIICQRILLTLLPYRRRAISIKEQHKERYFHHFTSLFRLNILTASLEFAQLVRQWPSKGTFAAGRRMNVSLNNKPQSECSPLFLLLFSLSGAVHSTKSTFFPEPMKNCIRTRQAPRASPSLWNGTVYGSCCYHQTQTTSHQLGETVALNSSKWKKSRD